MRGRSAAPAPDLAQRLAEAEATIEALLSDQIDAVVDSRTQTPVLLSRAQEALRESEERYRRIVETANEGIWTIDTGGNLGFVNPRIAAMLGQPVDAMLGAAMSRFVPADEHAEAAQRLERSRRGYSDEQEIQLLRADGSELWVMSKSSPIRDASGAYLGTLEMMTDHSIHRQDQEALRKSEEQYRQIVETTTDGIIKSDRDGVILFVNPRLAEMAGYLPSEMIGKSVFAFMSPAARMITEAAFRRRRAGVRDAAATDTTFRHRGGAEIAVNIAGSPVLDADGQYVGNLTVIRDMTRQKELQSQLMVSDRMASVGTLAAGVAHEINNPLAAVLANLDYIGDSLMGPKARDPNAANPARSDTWTLEEIRAPLGDAREAAQRVRLIVRDLKIFSRSPEDQPSGPVDVQAILESSLRMAWNEIRHRARLIKTYGKVPPVQANEARLGQVFLNLIVNAAQAMPEGRVEENELRLTTSLEGARVIIAVQDTGDGIPPENLGRIFDAFFTTKPVGVGTGLGLAICHRIVTDLGGALTVESQLGVGTTFRVALPVAAEDSGAELAPVEPVAAAGRRGRILVVDDEELVVRAVKRVLSKDHDVVTMVAARDGLALCQSGERFDLILCDLMMPDMSGMDFYRELVRDAPDQADRIIFLTGGAFTASARQFLSETTNEHIEKPFEAANLGAIVRRYLR